jgi:Mg-chelatase subunit ChlD
MGSWRGGEPAGEEKRSWRKQAKVTSAKADGKYWATGGRNKPVVSGNLIRLFVALLVLVATTTGMVVFLFNWNEPTPLVSLITVEYQHPWAPNAWAIEDQQRLDALNEKRQFKVASKQQSLPEGTWEQLIDLELEKIEHGGPGGSLIPAFWGYYTVVVHLSTHGVLNAAGQPCLLFADADPLDDQSWVPLTKVLRSIGENKKIKNGKDVRVLVVLDSGKQPPDIRCGLLCGGFIEAAREQIQALPFANFAVLLPCDEDQCAWTAPEMGGSVFGVMVTSGLQGRADSRAANGQGGNGNGRVTVQELAKFVSATVDGYVREYRGRAQSPQLVWCGENQANDFELCHQAAYQTSVASTYQSNKDAVKVIKDAWQEFENWKHPSYATWQRATASNRIARAEQLLWAGAGYQDQFISELAAAVSIMRLPKGSDWPTAICGASLEFLNRVHGIDTNLELEAVGLDSRSLSAAKPVNSAADAKKPAPTSSSPSPAEAASAPPTAAGNAVGEKDANKDETSTAKVASPENPSQAQRLVAWLTFDSQTATDAPPPERPLLPDRPLAIACLTSWLAQNPQQVNSRVMARVVDWLGPITDAPSVSREEAMLRTINDHLQLTSSWNLPTADKIAHLWSQYLQTALAGEDALALVDPRATKTLEREAAELVRDLQLVRDHIHGCESEGDVSVCAKEIEALQSEVKKVLNTRNQLEQGWELRDELALELPTLAQWISSPIGRLQSTLQTSDAWDQTGQLIQQHRGLQAQLAAGKIPDTSELKAIEEKLDQLLVAYSQTLRELIQNDAQSQRRPLGNLMLSLGLRFNSLRGLTYSNRAKLHDVLDDRYSDLVNSFSDESLEKYCAGEFPEGIDDKPIWRLTDLPQDLTTYPPLLFTETASALPWENTLATTVSERNKWCALGGELRRRWSKLPQQLADSSQSSIESMSSLDEAVIRDAEERLLGTEYRAHLLAQLLPSDSKKLASLSSLPRLTHEVCNELFAIWQARRALADFWKTPKLPQAPLFMSASASDWLKAVTHHATGPAKSLEQFQSEEVKKAVGWGNAIQQVTSEQDVDDEWQAELSVNDVPSGSAWLRLQLGGNSSRVHPLQNRRFQTKQQTGVQAETPTRIPLLTGKLPEGNHELLAWFRGHVSSKPISVYKKQPPVILAWQAEEVGTTTIRVDAETKPARIVFVLDCSGSMHAEPMRLAKETLLDVIRELSRLNAGKTEVAVVLFGHTAEFNNALADSHSNWPGRRNRPFNDVEVVQDLVTPTEQVINALQNTLARVEHFGRTPLYEAIIQSIDLMVNRNDGFVGEQRVVIITDGEDNIFPFADGVAGNARAKGNLLVPNRFIHSPETPIKRATEGGVNLDFVSFNFDAKDDIAVLERMAADSGGKVYEASNKDLAEQLRNSIARHTFSTTAILAERTIGSHVRLSDVQIIPGDQLPGKFEVKIDDTADKNSVVLLGGEAIEMQYTSQRGLTFVPYHKGDDHPQTGTFSYDGHPYQALMLTGVPDSIPQVRICLQSQNPTYQSQRPSNWMLELQRTQLGQAGQGERIAWTADALWENYHNSPVLRVTIKNLPDLGRDRLECRLWLRKNSNTQPVQRLPIARLAGQATVIAPGVEVSTATELEAGGLLLTVSEKREPDAPLVHWQVFPTPDKFVEHQVHGLRVDHKYFYSDRTVLNKLELAATPLPAAVDNEWQATQWIPVPKWK